jgi:Xaa-Pro dipeptidase
MKPSNLPSRIERLKTIQEASDLDAFLFTSASSIKWLSGYFYNFETGPSPFQLLPAALLIVPEKTMTLIIADNESLTTPIKGSEVSIVPYASYVFEKPLDHTHQFLSKLDEVLQENDLRQSRIGIEQCTIPHVVTGSIRINYPKNELVDISSQVTNLKMIKDPDEIEFIRAACNLCDIGQAVLLEHPLVGMTELELFTLVRSEMEASAGMRVPMMADMVSGQRTSTGGGNPTNKVIQKGDLILSDITPCLNGYWGDSCNTVAAGKATSQQLKTFTSVEKTLEMGIKAIRPGARAKEIDSIMRKNISGIPHHGGHGIGTMYHEEPRIVPYNDTILLPNMVIAIEPGIYEKDYGIRLEHLIVVTETGCDVLTKFQHCFEINN